MIKSRARAAAKIVPFAHQRVSLAHDAKNPAVYDASDAGTGKTAVRIWSFAERRRQKGGKALILAPRTLLKSVWLNDFKKFAGDMKAVIAPADSRQEAFDDATADVYITNHDAVKWLAKIPKKSKFWAQFSELIIDEPTAFKHHASQRSRALLKIAKLFKQRKGMTATPNSNGICDIWHQILVLDDGKRLGTSFYAFRNTTCTPVQVGRHKQAIQWTDKDGAEEAVFGLLSDIVIRHKFDECVDIPKTHHYTVDYELPPKQRKTYETMEESQLLLLTKANAKITAINAAAVATKLLQISSGAVYESTGKYHVIDTARYEMIMDMIEQRAHCLVFFNWKHQKEQLTALADKRGISYCVMDGDATDTERSDMVQVYQNGGYKVMFAHPRSAAHGLTLTRGTSTIWAGPTYDLELFEQGNKRQARIGQTQKTEVVVVIAKDTIEEKVYEMLTAKNVRMRNLLDLFSSLKDNVPEPVEEMV